MKNVWLFGDSIRLNYQHVVKRELDGECSVFSPAENGKFAKYTLCMLFQWSADYPKPDVIHWNNGIWDAFRFHPGKGPLTSVEDYCRDTLLIADALASTGAKLIFATSTPTRAPSHDTAVTQGPYLSAVSTGNIVSKVRRRFGSSSGQWS